MKLLMVIVQSDDSRVLLDRLLHSEFRATVISTTGGFLREGNSTIIIGVRDERVEEALRVIRESSRTRTQYVNPVPPIMEPGELHVPTPIEVAVGGATVFILNVERFEHY